jgi:hypothetical protein
MEYDVKDALPLGFCTQPEFWAAARAEEETRTRTARVYFIAGGMVRLFAVFEGHPLPPRLYTLLVIAIETNFLVLHVSAPRALSCVQPSVILTVSKQILGDGYAILV